jgi:hypothetical protein
MAKKSHKYAHTHITHHSDGSHTVHHEHEDGKSHEDYATGSHDGMMDGLMHFTGEPNPGEAEAVAGQGAGEGALPQPMGEKVA